MINIQKLDSYLKHTHFWVERTQDESFVAYPLFVVRVPTALLPQRFRPECDGTYEYAYTDAFEGLRSGERSIVRQWQSFLPLTSLSKLILTNTIDIVERSKFHAFTDDDGCIHWLSSQFMAFFRGDITYELLPNYAIRVWDLSSKEPIAILGERVKK